MLHSEVMTTDNKYYKTKYESVNVDRTRTTRYKVKKDDNLWTISKEHLKNKNATNAEIQDMMYKIAKLNNKDSMEEINSLKINDVIYLPEAAQEKGAESCFVGDWFQPGPPKKAAAPVVQESGIQMAKKTTEQIKQLVPELNVLEYNQHQVYQVQNRNSVPPELYTAHGKAGLKYWSEILSGNSDGSLIIEKSYTYSSTKPTALHIVKKIDTNPYSPTEAHMYVQTDKSGKLEKVSFNAPWVHINSISFDYELKKDGTLSKPGAFVSSLVKIEQLPEEQYKELLNTLQEYLDKELPKS